MADDNTGSWMDFAQRSRDDGGLGLAPHQAAGLVGNLQNESGSGITPWGVSGDNGTAQGSAQWRGDRLQALKDHADDNDLDYRTPEAQQSFMRQEFDTTHNSAYKALQAAATPEDAANVVNRQYEISADRSGNRERSARSLMDGPTAIQSAMGITKRPKGNAMALNDEDEEETPATAAGSSAPPALSAAATLGAGALGPGGVPVQQMPRWAQILSALGDTAINMAPGIAQDPAHAQVLQAAATANKGTQGTWSTNFDPKTGLATQIGSNGQTRQFKYAAPRPDDKKWVITGYDDNGKPVHGPQPSDEEAATANAAAAAAPPKSQLLGDDSKEDGPDYYKTLDPVNRGIIDGWHDGTGIIPSSRDMAKPALQKLIASAKKAYPDTDFTDLVARKKLAGTLTDSGPSSNGGTIANSNTAISILNQAADKHIALHNGGDVLGSSKLGNAGNWMSNANSTSERAETMRGLAANADDASGEITKVITGSGGGVDERKVRSDRIGNPNYVPREAAGALEAEANDLKAKHVQVVDKVRQTMGQSYLDKHPVIEKNFEDQDTALRAKIEQLRGGSASTSPTPTAAAPMKTKSGVTWSIN